MTASDEAGANACGGGGDGGMGISGGGPRGPSGNDGKGLPSNGPGSGSVFGHGLLGGAVLLGCVGLALWYPQQSQADSKSAAPSDNVLHTKIDADEEEESQLLIIHAIFRNATGVAKLLGSASPKVQALAMTTLWVLFRVGTKSKNIGDIVPALVETLASTSVKLQLEAAGLLGHLAAKGNREGMVGAACAILPVVKLLECGPAEARQQAAAVTGGAAEALRHLLRTEDLRAKVAAAGAIPPLVRLLDSTSTDVQESAAGALALLAIHDQPKVAAAGAIPALVRLLDHSSVEVQLAAAEALGNLSASVALRPEIVGAGAVPPLQLLLASPSAKVQKAAKATLRKLK